MTFMMNSNFKKIFDLYGLYKNISVLEGLTLTAILYEDESKS